MERKYYEAYDDRYRQVHSQGLRWFAEMPTAIIQETIEKYQIPKTAKLLELGCGEGRDARALLSRGYDVLATDISAEAVSYCRGKNPGFEKQFRVLDCVKGELGERFDFLYTVAVIHMLVEDGDRRAMLSFVREHLTENGIGLICSMGDGEIERSSDVSTAFGLQERIHEETGRTVCIAGTSYRAVSFETFEGELKAAGLVVHEMGLADGGRDYSHLMYAVVRRKS